MSGLSDRRFDLNFGKEAAMPSQDNIWRPSFLSHTGLLTVGDFVMKNDMTAAVVAMNLLTSKDNRLLCKRSDKLAVKDSLALSVQCAGSVFKAISNRWLARGLVLALWPSKIPQDINILMNSTMPYLPLSPTEGQMARFSHFTKNRLQPRAKWPYGQT
ncbi:hypothetical protein ACFX2J_046738 [Malus domestica]